MTTPDGTGGTPAAAASAAVGVRRLAVTGALEFTPQVFRDERGRFVPTYQERVFTEAVGHPFPLVHAGCSESRRGVVRGVHFTRTPPGIVKYVYCARGRALDLVVDLRVGSPTFGRWDSVLLDQESFRSTYFPVGSDTRSSIHLDHDPIMSERDRDAPTLAQAHASGLLPTYADSVKIENSR